MKIKKMRKHLLVLAAACLTLLSSMSAQNRNCGTMEYLQEQLKNDPAMGERMQQIEQFTQNYLLQNGSNRMSSVITVPVVFHLVYNTSAQNIPDARILEQLNVLNNDYARTNADAVNTPSVFQSAGANTGIQFCLAVRDPSGNSTTGIIRKSTTTSSFSSNDNVKHNSTGGDDAWPAASYLNIWICNLGGGLLGYAQFPGGSASTDGVVVLYSSVGGPNAPGTLTPYHLGRTATHEVGHWLNLRHIWGDANCGNDFVGDTPTQQTSNFGCPNFPHVTCSNGPNGDMFMNYMDYTDDACMNIFTSGQSSRSNALFISGGSRYSILSSQGCVPVSTCGTPSNLSAANITQTGATLNWGAVSGATSYNVQYRISPAGSWTLTTSTINSKSVSGLTAGTTYDYEVQSVCSGNNGTYSSVAQFTTSAAGGCNGDPYENNNKSSKASSINTNTDIYATISSSTDKDWFIFTTTSASPKINVLLTNLPFNYDIRLYNSALAQLKKSVNAGTANESIVYNSSSTGATYYVKVYPVSGSSTTSCYTLRVNASANNFREISNDVEKNEDVSLYPNPAKNQLTITLFSDENQTSVISVIDVLGRSVINLQKEVTEGVNKFDIDLKNIRSGVYYVEVINNGEKHFQKLVIEN